MANPFRDLATFLKIRSQIYTIIKEWNKMGLSLTQILKSKTVWTFVAMAIFNGVQSVSDLVPAGSAHNIINAGLTIAGILFRAFPSQVPAAPK